ncbi:MAG: diguanylate cyclase [Thermostichales cyanobacterium SRBZ-1_bins_19]
MKIPGIPESPARILVVDDDASSREFLVQMLRESQYQVVSALNGRAAWEMLSRCPVNELPDLILCDWIMPDISGIELCRRIKANPEMQLCYFILLTARSDVEDRVVGLDAGADDFITKPVDCDELLARVRAGLRLHHLTEALAQANRQLQARNELLESLSMTDPLTGVLNRRALDQGLPQMLQQVGPRYSEARYRYMCLMMIDVDHFKSVNDTFGHYVGDCVLQVIARRLQAHLRPASLLYRYGGEEFVCVTPGISPSRCLRYADYLRSVIHNTPIAISPKKQVPVTISIGIGVSTDLKPVDADTLIKQADQALYQAKALGRNRVFMEEIQLPSFSLQQPEED